MCNNSGTKMSILQHLFSFGRAGASVLERCVRRRRVLRFNLFFARRGSKNKIFAATPHAGESARGDNLFAIVL